MWFSPRSSRSLRANTLPTLALLLGVLTLVGCSDDPNLFVDLRWQVKCAGSSGCLASDHPQHDFFTYSGGLAELPADNPQRFTARCSLTELDSGDLLWSFSAETSSYSFSVRNARIPAGGGAVSGSSCLIVVVDDVNTYEGRCGSAAPSEDQPCRFTSVGLSNSEIIDGLPGRTLSTTIECDGIRNQILDTESRDIRAPDNLSAAPLNLVNCEGFPF